MGDDIGYGYGPDVNGIRNAAGVHTYAPPGPTVHAEPDVLMAYGWLARVLMVLPRRDMVVVSMGQTGAARRAAPAPMLARCPPWDPRPVFPSRERHAARPLNPGVLCLPCMSRGSPGGKSLLGGSCSYDEGFTMSLLYRGASAGWGAVRGWAAVHARVYVCRDARRGARIY